MTSIRDYIEGELAPHTEAWEREQGVPREAVQALADLGLLGAGVALPDERPAWKTSVWGEALEAVGQASMSLLSVLTVHAMCAHAVHRWGEPAQKNAWLPGLASGTFRGAFALSEPAIGCDAKNVEARLEDGGDHWRLSGRKRWISAAMSADVFLVIAQAAAGPTAVLVSSQAIGFVRAPIEGLLGFRAADVGELIFQDVVVPKSQTIGPEGLGFSHVASSALDVGRFCIACGCTGLIRACVRASVDYSRSRHQFGVALREHQLIQAMIADMATSYKAARALWRHAAELRQQADPTSMTETSAAKYFASTAASRAANDAVQIHGANGCGADYPVQRYFRDARIGEIIEGSNQMQQIMLAGDALREFASPRARKGS